MIPITSAKNFIINEFNANDKRYSAIGYISKNDMLEYIDNHGITVVDKTNIPIMFFDTRSLVEADISYYNLNLYMVKNDLIIANTETSPSDIYALKNRTYHDVDYIFTEIIDSQDILDRIPKINLEDIISRKYPERNKDITADDCINYLINTSNDEYLSILYISAKSRIKNNKR